MTTTPSSRSSGGFRGYTNEQKTLRAKLDHLLKWTRDLKSNIMKQSCKVLQTNNNNSNIHHHHHQQIINQIHHDLDEYKRKLDRELGRIHDICDALINNSDTTNNSENLRNEILEALRRSPTYSSLEQHIYDDTRPRIRVKPREKIHPGQKQIPRTSSLSTDTIKRKASQPVTLQVLDTAAISGTKQRSQIAAFKRSRSFTNVEHRETQLGMDYIEEDENDLSWKPFGPKKSTSTASLTSINNEQSNDEQPTTSTMPTSQSLPNMPLEKSKESLSNDNNNNNNDSSDEEFDVAWQRRVKQKARKESALTQPVESPSKRTVRFSPSTNEQVDLIELDLDETARDGLEQTKDQNNNNNNNKETEVVQLDDDDDELTTTLTQQINNRHDDSQIIDDSDDDEVIPLNDDEIPKRSTISRKKPLWTTSEIQITTNNSQSQSLHNPYRIGIADPSLRSVFLPPPPPPSSSATNSQLSSGTNKRTQNTNRKTSPNKRATNSK